MTEVESGAQTSASPESRLAAFFGGQPAPEPAAQHDSEPEAAPQESQPEPQAESQTSDEPTVDDLPDDQPPETDVESLEITFNGTPIKLTKEEAKERAQLGELYRRNQEQFDRTWQQAQALAQQAQQMVQLTPELQQTAAMAQLYDQALKQFDPAAMRKLASEDPAAYLEKRAEYDALALQAQQAQAAYQQQFQQFQAKQTEFRNAQLAQEFELLPKLIPQWRDQTRAAKERKELADALQSNKLRPATIEAVANNAELLAMAYKAQRYDALQASKREKVAQATKAPAMLKPGASTANNSSDERYAKARQQLRKSGSVEDAARLLMQRMR